MDSPAQLPAKREALVGLLTRGSVRVFLDPRRPDVTVPRAFERQSELVLRIGYAITPAIVDLVIGDDSWSATLSFNKRPSFCHVPFSAVFAIVSDVDNRTVIWPEDAPLGRDLSPKAAEVGARVNKPRPAARRPSARPVPSPTQPERQEPASASTPPSPGPAAVRHMPKVAGATRGSSGPRRPLPPYLRVVK